MSLSTRIDRFRRFIGQSANPSDDSIRAARSAGPDRSPSLLRRLFRPRPAAPRQIIQSQSQQIARPPVPQIVCSFVDQLTTEKLSNVLIWFLYFDIVELPASPAQWYSCLPSMELRGWIALGTFLQTNTGFVLELVKMDSACDRMSLSRTIVRSCIITVSNHDQMRFSQIAHIVTAAEQQGIEEAIMLDSVQTRLRELKSLAGSLRPLQGTTFASWRKDVYDRLVDYLDVVIHPRLSTLRGGIVLLTGRTQEEEQHIEYLFEAIQEPRPVPLSRYGIFSDPSVSSRRSSINSRPHNLESLSIPEGIELDDSNYTLSHLLDDRRFLRSRLHEVEQENERLKAQIAAIAFGPRPLVSAPIPSTQVPKRKAIRNSLPCPSKQGSSPMGPRPSPRAATDDYLKFLIGSSPFPNLPQPKRIQTRSRSENAAMDFLQGDLIHEDLRSSSAEVRKLNRPPSITATALRPLPALPTVGQPSPNNCFPAGEALRLDLHTPGHAPPTSAGTSQDELLVPKPLIRSANELSLRGIRSYEPSTRQRSHSTNDLDGFVGFGIPRGAFDGTMDRHGLGQEFEEMRFNGSRLQQAYVETVVGSDAGDV